MYCEICKKPISQPEYEYYDGKCAFCYVMIKSEKVEQTIQDAKNEPLVDTCSVIKIVVRIFLLILILVVFILRIAR